MMGQAEGEHLSREDEDVTSWILRIVGVCQLFGFLRMRFQLSQLSPQWALEAEVPSRFKEASFLQLKETLLKPRCRIDSEGDSVSG